MTKRHPITATPQDPFLQNEMLPGALLLFAAVLALILDNSPLSPFYDALLDTPLSIRIGALSLDKPLLLWINDGLMAVFFLFVALEIKRELAEGELSTPRKAALPVIAALGGMILPAAIFAALNGQTPQHMQGWAVPTATDIAFALGVLALLGKRAPPALKTFLLSLAIIDDLGAIVIIAVFYTDNLSFAALAGAGVGIVALIVLNRLNVIRRAPYILLGVFVWVCVLKSGVHATLAGVCLGLAIPLRAPSADSSPLVQMEHDLKPWISFFIMPIFAFANAGVGLSGLALSDIFAPLPLGIAVGLFLGKQIGVFGFSFFAVKLKICNLPTGIRLSHIYGVALLAGIGFTMSLFIGSLAFETAEQARAVRLGVLSGSLLSGLAGYFVLKGIFARQKIAPA